MYRLSDLTLTKIFGISQLYSEKGKGGKRVNRPNWALIYKYEGETQYHFQGKTYRSDASHPVLLPKGIDYAWTSLRAGRYFAAEFDCEQTASEPISIPIRESQKLLKIFQDFENGRGIEGSSLKSTKALCLALLLLINELQADYVPSEKKKKLAPAVRLIAEGYRKKLTNDELADESGLSTVYFRKLFKQVYGVSPMQYVSDFRIAKAKEMLQSDYGTVSELALSLGYPDVYAFSRDFKKRTGVSPSRYGKKK